MPRIAGYAIAVIICLSGCQRSSDASDRAVTAPNSADVKIAAYVNSLPEASLDGLSKIDCDLEPKKVESDSTYDRVKRKAEAENSVITNVYDAYRCGRMTQQDAAIFEFDVRTGRVISPGPLKKTPSAPIVPSYVIKAYNEGQLSADQKARLKEALENGVASLPLDMTINQ